MEYKLIACEDEQAVRQLWHYCFEKSYDPFYKWYFTHYYKNANTLGCYKEGKLLACLQLIPYTIFLRGSSASVSYIVGVSTYPEGRGVGAVRGLLKAALAEMKDRGQYASILMPSKAEFYYPHQWEMCYHDYKYSFGMSDLAGMTAKWGDFYPYQGPEDVDKLADVYEAFTRKKHGYVIRSRDNWMQLADSFAVEEGNIYILKDGTQPAGYIFYTLRDRTMLIREMAYVSQEAQYSLFRFIYNHRSQADQVEWYAPYDDLTHFKLPDPKKNVTLYPFMTGRIVDVKRALENAAFPAHVTCCFTLAVQDPLASWNNDYFAVAITAGKAAVQMLEHQTCDITCTIGAFSQMYFGRLNAAELAYMGRLQGQEDAVAVLDQLFPKCCNYINEYF